MSLPIRADWIKAGERFQVAGLEYHIVSVWINRDSPMASIQIEAVRGGGTGRLDWFLQEDDWVTLTHRIPDEW